MQINFRRAYQLCLLGGLLALGTWQALAQTPPPVPPPATEPATASKTDQEPIRVNSTLITVPITVTDRFGRFVTGLGQSDFSVREDGNPQEIHKFFATEAPFNVVLLIDTSRSTVRKLGAIQKAAETFIKQLQPRDRVMVITFDDRINVISDFTGDASLLKKAIKSAKPGYSTRLYDAINYAITDKLLPLSGRKAIVVLTDGVDTASKGASYDSVVEQLASVGIVTYAIQYETRNEGVNPMSPFSLPGRTGSLFAPFKSNLTAPRWGFVPDYFAWRKPLEWVEPQGQSQEQRPLINLPRPSTSVINSGESDPQPQQPGLTKPAPYVLRDRYLIAGEFLRTIAVVSGGRPMRADTIENTSFAFELIANELRNQYTIDYYTNNELRDGRFRTITVNLKATEYDVRTRRGYRAPKEANK